MDPEPVMACVGGCVEVGGGLVFPISVTLKIAYLVCPLEVATQVYIPPRLTLSVPLTSHPTVDREMDGTSPAPLMIQEILGRGQPEAEHVAFAVMPGSRVSSSGIISTVICGPEVGVVVGPDGSEMVTLISAWLHPRWLRAMH